MELEYQQVSTKIANIYNRCVELEKENADLKKQLKSTTKNNKFDQFLSDVKPKYSEKGQKWLKLAEDSNVDELKEFAKLRNISIPHKALRSETLDLIAKTL